MSTYITFASIMKNSNSRILNDFDLLILALKFLGWNFENFWLNLAWWEIEKSKWRFEVRSWVFHDRIDNNHQWRDPPRWNPDEMRLKVLSGIISAWYSRWTRLISELEKSQNLNWNILHLVLTVDLNFELGQAVLLEVDLGIFRKNLKTVTIWFDREFDFQSGRPWQSGPDLWILRGQLWTAFYVSTWLFTLIRECLGLSEFWPKFSILLRQMTHFEMGNKTKVGQSDRIELIFECYIL